VLYGLLGYAWFLRRRSSELAALFSRFNTTLWVAWLFGCLVLSRLGWVSVGNAAHFAGLASGALLGWSFTRPRLRWLFAAVSLASLALPIAVANVRRPWSANWCAGQAWSAHKLGDLDSAQQWYSRSLDLGTDADWCRNRLGHVALSRGDRDGHAEQLAALRASGSTQAEDLEEFAVARAWYADALERETYEPRRVALQARLDLCDWKLDVARRGFEQLALDGDIGFERTVGLAWCIAFDPDADAGTVRAALERVRAATSERYAEYPTLRELLDTLEQRANESE
jgi:hypothetical protein